VKYFVIVLILFIVSLNAHASSYEEESARIKKLDEKCIQARTEKLKVVQKEKIEICVNIDKRDRAYCERYFKDYGWGAATASGHRNSRLFDQIPECIEVFNARKNRRR